MSLNKRECRMLSRGVLRSSLRRGQYDGPGGRRRCAINRVRSASWRRDITMAALVTTSALLATSVEATTVTVYGALHGANRAIRVGTTSTTLSISGYANQFDLGLDEVQARASVAAGALRILAREGGNPSDNGARFGAVAGATLLETITITGVPGPRTPITIAYHVSADPETLLLETGNALGFGRAQAEVFGNFFVETTFRGANGFARTERGDVRFSQVTSHDFVPVSPSVQGTATPNGPFLTLGDNISSSRPHLPIERTLDARAIVTSNAINVFGVELEVDVLAAPGDMFVIGAALEAEVDGTTGNFASLNALNTGLLSISLPQGLGFESDSGVFLTAVVPLPPGLALLLSALAGLSLTGRRSTPDCVKTRTADSDY